jgi:hypothetical protein
MKDEVEQKGRNEETSGRVIDGNNHVKEGGNRGKE